MKKISLVTGSTQGIGLALARKLSEKDIVIINDNKGIEKDFIKKILKVNKYTILKQISQKLKI